MNRQNWKSEKESRPYRPQHGQDRLKILRRVQETSSHSDSIERPLVVVGVKKSLERNNNNNNNNNNKKKKKKKKKKKPLWVFNIQKHPIISARRPDLIIKVK